MLKKYVTFIVIALCAIASVQAQPKKLRYTVSGYLKNAQSGEALIGANIYDFSKKMGTTSNTYGFYSISFEAGTKASLTFSYTGYQKQTKDIELTQNLALDIEMQPSTELKEVVITAETAQKIEERTSMSVVEIPIEQIKKIPALMGEVDIIKVLQLLPGVQSGGEGQSGLYVRGGGPDQNLILLDGVPVYNASHLFGFFSVFNADAISDVTLTKGGFPARYGGRLSSVIDIKMKEGNQKKFSGSGSLGLIASKIALEGPIIKDKTSFIVSARRTYIDVLAQPFILAAAQGRGTGGYYFYDVNAKINHRIGPKDRLYLSMYTGKDKFYAKAKETNAFSTSEVNFGLGWGNLTSALRWNHQFSPKLFANTTATYSKYGFGVSAGTKDQFTQNGITQKSEYNLIYNSGINDLAAKIDFDYLPLPNHFVRFGASVIKHRFKPEATDFKAVEGTQTIIDTTFTASLPIDAIETAIYVEDDFKIGEKLKINPGLHFSTFTVRGTTYKALQPRLAVNYMLPKSIALKASYAEMQQYIHLLSNGGIGLPTDLWLPATDRVKPMRSQQVALGLAKSFYDNKFEISIEGYYKRMNGLIEYKNGSNAISSVNWEDKVETGGVGQSRGLEFFLQKKTGKTTGWIGYTLAKTDRQFVGTEINDGKVYAYRYDRRHDVSVVWTQEITKKIDFAATWVYGTGNAVTFPLQIYRAAPTNNNFGNFFPSDLEFYGQRNSFRMAAYHRLDLGISFKKETRWGERTWNVSVYNAYGRANPYFIYLASQYNYNPNTGATEVTRLAKQISLFPLIPSVSYNFKF